MPAAYGQAVAQAQQQPRQRMAWPDVAKGLSILGVVLLHITLAVPEGDKTFASEANEIIAPLRMPLFFLVSGFFSVKVLRFSFAELCLKRLWFLAVPYVLWAPVEMWVKRFEWHAFLGDPMPEFELYKESLLESSNMYWFLHALILFTVVLWATKILPPWARWVMLIAVIAFAPLWPYPAMVSKVATYLPCFLIGAYARSWIAQFAEHALQPWALVIGLMTFFAGRELLEAFQGVEDPELAQIIVTVATLLHLPSGIILVVLLAKTPLIGQALQKIGQHTLVIYLSHPIALTMIFGYCFRYREGGISLEGTGLDSTNTWIVLCIPITIIGALAFHAIATMPVVGWTIFPPHLLPQRSSATPSVPAPRARSLAAVRSGWHQRHHE